MKQYLLLLIAVFFTLSCGHQTPREYADQYPIEEIIYPECPTKEFCLEKASECKLDSSQKVDTKKDIDDENPFDYFFDYNAAHDYCHIGYFALENEKKCSEAMYLVCERIHNECLAKAKACGAPQSDSDKS